jgi:hypothetical protein
MAAATEQGWGEHKGADSFSDRSHSESSDDAASDTQQVATAPLQPCEMLAQTQLHLPNEPNWLYPEPGSALRARIDDAAEQCKLLALQSGKVGPVLSAITAGMRSLSAPVSCLQVSVHTADCARTAAVCQCIL